MREPTVAPDLEDHVVAVLAVCDVAAGAVDDMIGAEGSDPVHLRGAAHTGDLSSEGPGDLDGEGAHASRRADDQAPRERAAIGHTGETLALRWIPVPAARDRGGARDSRRSRGSGMIAGQPRLCGAPCCWARRRRASAPWTARSSSLHRVMVVGREPYILARYRS